MVRKVVDVEDSIYNMLKNVARRYGVRVSEVLRVYVNSFDVVEEVLSAESNFLRKYFKLRGDELIASALTRVLNISQGMYNTVLVIDEVLGLWRKGFILSEVSGGVIDKDYNIRGIMIYFEGTEVSSRESLVDHVELQIHDSGCALEVESHINIDIESNECGEDIIKKVEDVLRTYGLKEELEGKVLECGGGGGVDVVLEREGGLSIKITVYTKKFNCLPNITEVDRVLAKIIKESGISDVIEGQRELRIDELIKS